MSSPKSSKTFILEYDKETFCIDLMQRMFVTGRRLATRRKTPDNAEGAVSLIPSTNTRAKYCQPHRSRGESTRTTIGSLGRTTGVAWHRPPLSFGQTAGDNRRYWGIYFSFCGIFIIILFSWRLNNVIPQIIQNIYTRI